LLVTAKREDKVNLNVQKTLEFSETRGQSRNACYPNRKLKDRKRVGLYSRFFETDQQVRDRYELSEIVQAPNQEQSQVSHHLRSSDCDERTQVVLFEGWSVQSIEIVPPHQLIGVRPVNPEKIRLVKVIRS
jgi:hypothetical protein